MTSTADDGDYRNEIDVERLRLLVKQEYAAFIENFDRTPITQSQDIRGFFVAWAAVFVPEAFDQKLIEDLVEQVQAVWNRPKFWTTSWYRSCTLEVAAYSLTHEYWYLDVCLANIDHHNSVLRVPEIRALSLVAHRIHFTDENLLTRTRRNLEVGHDVAGCLALILAAKGDREEKQKVLEEWLSDRPTSGSVDWSLVQTLCQEGYIANPFLEWWLQILGHVAFRALEQRPISFRQQSLFDDCQKDKEKQPLLFEIAPERRLLDKACERMWSHPLAAAYLRLVSR